MEPPQRKCLSIAKIMFRGRKFLAVCRYPTQTQIYVIVFYHLLLKIECTCIVILLIWVDVVFGSCWNPWINPICFDLRLPILVNACSCPNSSQTDENSHVHHHKDCFVSITPREDEQVGSRWGRDIETKRLLRFGMRICTMWVLGLFCCFFVPYLNIRLRSSTNNTM